MKELFGNETIVATDIEYVARSYSDNVRRVSISGVQDKLFAVMEGLSYRLVKDGEQSRYIIKPAPENHALINRLDMPANEYLTMQIAKHVYGINTAKNGLIRMKDGRLAYIVRRFDVADNGSKLYQEDMASIMGRRVDGQDVEYKYSGNYLEMGLTLKDICPIWRFELLKYLRIILFNYLFSNGDAHLKNFSVCRDNGGRIIMTPSYDLMNTSLHIQDDDFAMNGGLGIRMKSDAMERTGHPTIDDFINLGIAIGLNERQLRKELLSMAERSQTVFDMCNDSYLSDKAKRMYAASYEKKLAWLNRGR